MKGLDLGVFESLGFMLAGEADLPPELPKEAKTYKPKNWKPKLNTGAQQRVFKSKTRAVLAHGEKGSGKSWACTQKMVDHCVSYSFASAFMCLKGKNAAEKGGSWEKLITKILPEWREKRGLIYEIKEDRQHNPIVWLINDHRTFSSITLLSFPYDNQLLVKAPGMEPSFVFFDELTTTDSDAYYEAFSAQLGRRTDISWEAQQYVAACNPAGPSHWVHQKWFEDCYDENGVRDIDFEEIYCPQEENKTVDKRYFESLKKTYKSKPMLMARLVRGEWVDLPSGDSHFGDLFSPALHVRPLNENGAPDTSQGIMPLKDYPALLGIDSGSRFHAFSFMQYAPIDNRMRYLVFDEAMIAAKVPYSRLLPVVMRRLKFWIDLVGPLDLVAISDASAINVYRPGSNTGSFDYLDMQREWNQRKDEIGVPEMLIKAAPKFNGSVAARINTMQNLLTKEEFMISSRCRKHQKMLEMLEADKQKDGEEFDPERAMTVRRDNRYSHIWDSCSYVLLTGAMKPHLLMPQSTETQEIFAVA